MKRNLLALLVILSLLVGGLATVMPYQAGSSSLANNCGFSVNPSTGVRTPLTKCLLNDYGWPRIYLESHVTVILNNYHTIVPGWPQNVSSVIASSTINYPGLTVDWLTFSVVAMVVLTGAWYIFLGRSKPASKHRK